MRGGVRTLQRCWLQATRMRSRHRIAVACSDDVGGRVLLACAFIQRYTLHTGSAPDCAPAHAQRSASRVPRSAAHSREQFTSVPRVDVSPLLAARRDSAVWRECVRELRSVGHNIGFFYAVNHGVPDSLAAEVMRQSAAFFALPAAAKHQLHISMSPRYRGYSGVGAEHTNGEPDLKETLDLGLERRPAPAHVVAAHPYEVRYAAVPCVRVCLRVGVAAAGSHCVRAAIDVCARGVAHRCCTGPTNGRLSTWSLASRAACSRTRGTCSDCVAPSCQRWLTAWGWAPVPWSRCCSRTPTPCCVCFATHPSLAVAGRWAANLVQERSMRQQGRLTVARRWLALDRTQTLVPCLCYCRTTAGGCKS